VGKNDELKMCRPLQLLSKTLHLFYQPCPTLVWLTQQQIWVAQHIDLIKQAVSSMTRGEFDDRVESLLQHVPPGSTVQQCTDNTHDIAVGNDASVLDADMDDATSNTGKVGVTLYVL